MVTFLRGFIGCSSGNELRVGMGTLIGKQQRVVEDIDLSTVHVADTHINFLSREG